MASGNGTHGKRGETEFAEFRQDLELTVLVAEPIRRPNPAVAGRAVDRVDEAVALGLLGVLAEVLGSAEQPRGHAGPKGKDDEGEEVAHGHGAAPSLVDVGAERTDERTPVSQGCGARLGLL